MGDQSALHGATVQRRKPFGEQRLMAFQHRRREEALAKQRSARTSLTDRARKLALAESTAVASADDEAEPDASRAGTDTDMAERGGAPGARMQQGARSLRQVYAGQLMQPEWLVEVPCDLGTSWYCMARPEGQRCLLVSSGGVTVSRSRSGAMLHRFASCLPNGSAATHTSSDAYCILDAIYHELTHTYYLCDVMCWKGYSLYDCTTEFRRFWLDSKLAEEGLLQQQVDMAMQQGAGSMATQQGQMDVAMAVEQGAQPAEGAQDRPPPAFELLPAHDATPEGLRAAYSGPVPFVRDGIYLLHKGTCYTPGASHAALLWKDAACSRYMLETDAAGNVPQHQVVVLEHRMDRTVATADDPPFVLGRMPEAIGAPHGLKLCPGRLLRFTIRDGGITFVDGTPAGADLSFEGVANQRRGRADAISKVLFQYFARRQPITFQQLLRGAEGSNVA